MLSLKNREIESRPRLREKDPLRVALKINAGN
jgi:hypothetical protein